MPEAAVTFLKYTNAAMPVADTPTLRPPLKWAGGKRWQVPHLRQFWEPHVHRRLVEPFCGGLAVALGLMPMRAPLNDTSPHLINFYRWLQLGLTIPFRMENSEAAFYRCRSRFNELLSTGAGDTAEAACLFYYLNRTGYNGLCRFNRRGEFNVPFGRYRRIGYVSDFAAYRETLARWSFSSGDVETVRLEASDFVYADPPYDVDFTHYARGGFSWEDQERAAAWLAKHPGPVVLVNQATNRIARLYRTLGYRISYVDAPRLISCTGDRTPAREIIATRHL
jgi:DNA adenine methylase